MTQMRLNSIITLQTLKELTDKLDLLVIGNKFVAVSNHGQLT